MVRLIRLVRHLLTPAWWARRCLSSSDLAAIEQAVAASERRHRGELRVTIEGPLPLGALLAGVTTRARALDWFARLRVWDTEENNGVLIYLQLVDRCCEIVVDRGIARVTSEEEWTKICAKVQAHCARRCYREGLLAVIEACTEAIARHFPADGENANELPDRPLVS
ncbi:MAG: TPM domain-containing protein [Rhodocyclaceae bacterium]|nr:TPM domain-containing protein [Rhodocyclaceae bacterium]